MTTVQPVKKAAKTAVKKTAKKTPRKPAAKAAGTRATSKSAYTRKAEARLEETQAKIDGIKAKVKGAVADRQIDLQKQLEKTEKQVDSHLATFKRRLARLKDAGEDSWEDLREGVENAWEDLSQSLKKIVARFS